MKENRRTNKIGALWPILLIACIFVPQSGALAAVEDAQKLRMEGQSAAALVELERLVALDPTDPQPRLLLGLVYVDVGRIDDAMRICLELTRDFPRLAEPHNNLAVLYGARGEYDKARESLLAAIRVAPNFLIAHENLGDLYTKLAAIAYANVAELDPENAEARSKLAAINPLLEESSFELVKDGERTVALEKLESDPVSESVPPPTGTLEVVETLQAWADSWAERDSDRHLSFYIGDLDQVEGKTSADWAKRRRSAMSNAAFIRVELSNIDVTLLENGSARATFVQSYQSDRYADTVYKTMVFSPTEQGWKISAELSAKIRDLTQPGGG